MPKSSAPPVLPEVKFERVIRLARGDAAGVLVCAGLSLAFSLADENWIFAGFAALALACGAMEWFGQNSLQEGDRGGLQWLIGAQLCLYTVIVGYVVWRWTHFDVASYWEEIPSAARENLVNQMREGGLDPEADRELLLRTMNLIVCAVLLFVSSLYQIGLAFWYRAQAGAIAAVLGNHSTEPAHED